MLTIEETKEWAKEQHDAIGQKRADGAPYWTHVFRVAKTVSDYYKDEPDHDIVVKAALCHDIIEDTPVNFEELVQKIGIIASSIVIEVTNQYTKEDYPKWDRKKRKEGEAKKLGLASFNAKVVKLADIIDNLSDVDEKRPKMASKYKKEKGWVLDRMVEDMPFIVNTDIFKRARWLQTSKVVG
jgi:(p)ppGpp synthase/HD superfamily hydrolase